MWSSDPSTEYIHMTKLEIQQLISKRPMQYIIPPLNLPPSNNNISDLSDRFIIA